MGEFSNFCANQIINVFRGTNFAARTAYCAVFTTNSGIESNNPANEVSGNNYNRPTITIGNPSDGISNNTANVTFNVATGDWGTIVAAAIVDAPISNVAWGTNVNVLMWTMLDANKIVNSGDTLQFNTGDLDISVD